MKPIIAPLYLGQTGPEVANLQDVLLTLIDKNVIDISTNPELLVHLNEDRNKQSLDDTTSQVVRILQASAGIQTDPEGPVVDEQTAALINAKFAAVQAATLFSVSGQISYSSGLPLPDDHDNYLVRVYALLSDGPALLANLPVSAESTYSYSNYLSSLTNVNPPLILAEGTNGIKVVVVNSDTDQEVGSQDKYGTGNSFTIDVVVEDAAAAVRSEYEEVSNAIAQVSGGDIAGIDLSNATTLDALASQTGEQKQTIILMVQAFRLHAQLSVIPAEIWYGLLRQQMPDTLLALSTKTAATFFNALQASVAQQIIANQPELTLESDAVSVQSAISEYLADHLATQDPEQSGLMRVALYLASNNSAVATSLVAGYQEWTEAPDSVLSTLLEGKGISPEMSARFQQALKLLVYTGNNGVLTYRLLRILDGNPVAGDPAIAVSGTGLPLEQLIQLSIADWSAIIDHLLTDAAFFFPSFISGATPDVRKPLYAAFLKKQFDLAHPTHAVLEAVKNDLATPFTALRSGLQAFMAANPAFDLSTVPVTALSTSTDYDFSAVADKEAFIQEAATVQRLSNITTDFAVVSKLAQDGLASSLQIARQASVDFVDRYASVAGSADAAKVIYDSAQQNMLNVLNVVIDAKQSFLDPTPVVLSSGVSPAQQAAFAEWRSMFGSIDGCNCSQCQSVYSPAAYLTDLLHFLKSQVPEIHDQLMKRRPDIKDIELTCKNINTPVPHIDIVNELLEDLVSSEAALTTGPGGVIVSNKFKPYMMYARQTVANAASQRAIPEYVNTDEHGKKLYTFLSPADPRHEVTVLSPYNRLKDAIYPWSLPYNFYKRQIDTHLDIAGISGHELVQRFSNQDSVAAWTSKEYCAAYLNITSEEAALITGTAGGHLPYEYYGLKATRDNDPFGELQSLPDPKSRGTYYPSGSGVMTNSNWQVTISARVDVLLQQTGLTYNGLLELLDCFSINPIYAQGPMGVSRQLSIDRINTTVPANTCDLSLLKLSGATEDTFQLIHRFMRLKRATGWTSYELDKAIICIKKFRGLTTITIDDITLTHIAQIRQLTAKLNLDVESVCMLWRDINDDPYRNYQKDEPEDIPSEYQRLFRNPVLTNVNAAGYPFPAYLPTTATVLEVELSYLSGIFNVAGSELLLILNHLGSSPDADNKVAVTFPLLSAVRRHALLLNGLGMGAHELLLFRQLISADPAISNGSDAFADPMQAIRFIRLTEQSRQSGLTIDQVFYLLNDAPANNVEDQKLNAQALKTLNALRGELKKKIYPGYDAALDADGTVLLGLLQKVLEADKALYLMQIVQDTLANSDDRTNGKAAAFLDEETTFFLTTGDQANMIGLQRTAISRRAGVFEALTRFNEESVLQPFVVSFLSKELKMSEAILKFILNDCLQRAGIFTSGAFVDDIDQENYLVSWLDAAAGRPANAPDAFGAYYRLYKAATLVNAFRLSPDDVKAFWPATPYLQDVLNPAALPVRGSQTTAQVPFSKWAAFLRWMDVRKFLAQSMPVLYDALAAWRSGGASKEALLNKLAVAFRISEDDLALLLGDDASSGGVLVPSASAATIDTYCQAGLYLRVIDCLEMQHLLPSPMATLAKIAGAVQLADSQQSANEVIQAVKSQYSETSWQETIRPANDLMRTERRDAMVAYLLANPSQGYETAWLTVNDLYETMMVDVEMMSCMATTRVLLAVNTVQLWVDRILLGLEQQSNGDKLMLGRDGARQWQQWRRLYRVWEANRKVFIYPENWIEPELRDDKSPFFLELEKFLKQNELTADNVEDAYRTYLHRLEEVSSLEIVGYLNQDIKDLKGNVQDTVVHVWGRTKAKPQIYFYRKRVLGVWTAWEKMDVQIDSDNLAPVLWRGRLRVYWLTFTDAEKEYHNSAKEGEDDTLPEKYISIDLNWTELKHDKWQPRQMGNERLKTWTVGAARGVDIWWHQQNPSVYSDGWELTADALKDSFAEFKKSMIPYAQLDENSNLQIVLHGRMKVTRIKDVNAYLARNLSNLSADGHYSSYYNLAEACYFNSFAFVYADYRAYFTIKADKVYASDVNAPHTFFDTLVESFPLTATMSQYTYNNVRTAGYSHINGPSATNSLKLLGFAPEFNNAPSPVKTITLSRMVPDRNTSSYIAFDKFFYQDYNNTFFVEKQAVDLIGQINTDGVVVVSGYSKGTTPVLSSTPAATSPNVFNNLLGATAYRFYNFSHQKVEGFLDQLDKGGLEGYGDQPGLLNRTFLTDTLPDTLSFEATYAPTASVLKGRNNGFYPHNRVDFAFDSPTGIYNWELFFHIPMLIANKLMQDQKFEEARKWYHYVFDPTIGNAPTAAGFWNFPVFFSKASEAANPVDLMNDPNLANAVARWASDPFKPHLIARTRIPAYMKNVVMKYLDNLIGWGDMLFRTDTREHINEAALLYVLAAQLLGRRPVQIPARATPAVQTYAMLNSANLNSFSNAMVLTENVLAPSGVWRRTFTPPSYHPALTSANSVYYFCIPPNDKLASYWDTIADRIFKIRNCRNIDGIERELALYDPPIDPALLVKAAAAGLSLADALADINAPLPLYRFNIMAQKATELTQEVKGLGGQLLAALEKKDAEMLSLLRSSQELTMLNLVTEIKEQQVAESVSQINGLQQQQKMISQRRDHYQKLIDGGLNTQEQLQLDSLQASIPLQVAQGGIQTLASALAAIPNFKFGMNPGATFGGINLNYIMSAAASAVGTVAAVNSLNGQMASTKGSYTRRKEEWSFQLKTAETELKQIDIQITGAQIRRAMAELELRNHRTQLQNAQEMDDTMRSKYTNEELYDWMSGEIALTYFQAYKLALDVAKRAERCYRHELGLDTSDFIQPAYWDSLKKGLLAGEQLMFDIKRMEASYLDKNKRHLELTKHISMAQLCPDQLLALKADPQGGCTFELPEWIFDMDYPGQHLRRIKSVSVSIPCVTGPYTTVSCKLSLVSSKYRKTGALNGHGYAADEQYKQLYGSIQSIATSSAQNDSGMFEFSFRDERYLPFEGAGAISKWKIELPARYAQFDPASISDIILHMNYTALDEGSLAGEANTQLTSTLTALAADKGFMQLLDLKREFANEWFAYDQRFTASTSDGLELLLRPELFPYYTRGHIIELHGAKLGFTLRRELPGPFRLQIDYMMDNNHYQIKSDLAGGAMGTFAPVIELQGNVKRMRLTLTSNNGAQAERLSTYLDDLYLVALCGLGDAYTDPVSNDAPWPTTQVLPQQPATATLPSSITSNLLAWWKADAADNEVINGALNTWKDQSGKGNDIAAVDTSNRPAIVSNWRNGKPVLDFSGGQALKMSMLDLPGGTEDVTVILVGEKKDPNHFQSLFELSSDFNVNDGFVFFLNEFNSDLAYVKTSSGYNANGLSSLLSTGVQALYEIGFTMSEQNAETYVTINGTKYQNPSSGLSQTNHINDHFNSDAFYIGARGGQQYFAYFNLAEMILIPHKITADERTTISSYLKSKYDL